MNLPNDLPQEAFSAVVHRVVKAGIDPLSVTGSQKAGGRYNIAGEGALYASFTPVTASSEVARGLKLRGVDPRSFPPETWWVYEIEVSMETVLDLTNPATLARLGVTEEHLAGEDLAIPRAVATHARQMGCQGLIVPSAARTGERNLVVFIDRLTEPLRVVSSESILLAD